MLVDPLLLYNDRQLSGNLENKFILLKFLFEWIGEKMKWNEKNEKKCEKRRKYEKWREMQKSGE